jgi:hypothetical protein
MFGVVIVMTQYTCAPFDNFCKAGITADPPGAFAQELAE